MQPWCGFDAAARAVASTVSFGGDLSGGAQGVLWGRTCHIISKCLAGKYARITTSWESSSICIQYTPEQSGAAFGVNKSRACRFVWDANPMREHVSEHTNRGCLYN